MSTKKQVVVNFRVTSYEGDSEFSLPSSQAFSQIKQLMEEQNKWIYINGDVRNKELLTEQDLIDATEKEQPIILMNALAGGNNLPSKIIDIEFEVSKKATKKALSLEFEENKYAKIIKVVVSKEQSADVIRNRETIVRVIKKKLEDFAKETTQKFTEKLEEERQEFEDHIEEMEDEYDDAESDEVDDFEKLLDVELNKYF